MTRDVQAEIAAEVQETPVVLYMKGTRSMPQCGFSAAAVAILKDLGVPFKEVNILADSDKRDGIKQFSDWPTIPQLYVNGEFVGGSDIMREMHANGQLKELVAKIPK